MLQVVKVYFSIRSGQKWMISLSFLRSHLRDSNLLLVGEVIILTPNNKIDLYIGSE